MKFSLAVLSIVAGAIAASESSWTTLTPTASPIGATAYTGTFGIAVVPQTSASASASLKKRDVVSQVGDGQIQATTSTAEAVSTKASSTAQAISQIGDGQIQASTSTAKATSTAEATSTAQAISQIGDGQIQASTSTAKDTASAVSQISDGQIQASTSTAETSAVSQISDGQLQATTLSTKVTSAASESSDVASSDVASSSAAATESGSATIDVVSCNSKGSLSLTLSDAILRDSQGRIGSIVANRQFQFDGPPPQAGAIYAKGWSITTDGYLALGDSDIFYQCLSGSFYNLYDETLGAQCSEIKLEVVELVDC